jgi:hypothetical protein
MFDVSWDVQCCNASHNGLIHKTSNANKKFLSDRRQLLACALEAIAMEWFGGYGGLVGCPAVGAHNLSTGGKVACL